MNNLYLHHAGPNLKTAGWNTVLLLLAAILSGAVVLIVPFARAAMNCNQTAETGVFLAYCSNTFGDYEHAAYALDLEPSAVRNLEGAQVVFLGSSLSQFAFSTNATSRFFADHNLPHYLIGFGYSEGSAFPLSVISGLRMKAKLYIVHAMYMFSDHTSPPALQTHTWDGAVQGVRRKAAAIVASKLCKLVPCGGVRAFYRRYDNGHWLWQNVLHNPVGPNPVKKGLRKVPPPSAKEKEIANQLLERIGIPRECVILTVTPAATYDPIDFAATMAKHMGVPFIAPRIDSLVALDTAHLDARSAEL
ncbi:MAG: hypothetical protein J0H89_02970, partial [Rhizobiales bacterium]|nr:hypothetical protein [Hyphomicrobiales bacterium]